MSDNPKLTPELLSALGFSSDYEDWWSSGYIPGDNHTLIPCCRHVEDDPSYSLGGRGRISTVGDLFSMIYNIGIEQGKEDAGTEMRRLLGLREDQ